MSTKDSLEIIYSHLGGLNKKLMNDDFYQYFLRCVKTGKNNVGLTKKVIERTLKGDWLEKIEDCVIALDNIVRNPTRYIKNVEDIVPIETARGITTESIRHLAQHTSMIASVEDDGSVTPERILNVIKEESYDTYENRLFYTLLVHLDYFINKRLNLIKDSGKNINEFVLNGECFIGKEKISYRLNFACEGNTTHTKTTREELINADVSKLDVNQRIERIRRILYEFNDSALVRQLKDCELVRPPIHLNNVLQKNVDYMKVVELWTFITAYTDDGIQSNAVENTVMPDKEFLEEIYSLLPLEYVLMKQQMGGADTDVQVVDTSVKSFSDPQVIREQIENFVDSLDMEVEDIKKVFNESIAKRTRKRTIERNRINNIIKRVLEIEKVWMANEKARLKRKEQRLAEEAKKEKARLKELEKQQRALQKIADAEAKRLAKEQAIAQAEEEKRKAELLAQGLLVDETQVAESTLDVAPTEVDVQQVVDEQPVEQTIELTEEIADSTTEQPVTESETQQAVADQVMDDVATDEVTTTATAEQMADDCQVVEEQIATDEVVEQVATDDVADQVVADEVDLQVAEEQIPQESVTDDVAPVAEQTPAENPAKPNLFARMGNWFKNLGKKAQKSAETPTEEKSVASTVEQVATTEQPTEVVVDDETVIQDNPSDEIVVGEQLEQVEQAIEQTQERLDQIEDTLDQIDDQSEIVDDAAEQLEYDIDDVVEEIENTEESLLQVAEQDEDDQSLDEQSSLALQSGKGKVGWKDLRRKRRRAPKKKKTDQE